MKKPFILTLVTSLSVALSGLAHADSYYDYAKVKRVSPVYKYIKIGGPKEVCYPVHQRRRHDPGPAIVGAIVGGAIGNALGENTESTVVGAVLGGTIGHSSSHSTTYVTERCEVDYRPSRKVRKLKGYNVTYRYKGHAYNTFLRHHPGDKIKVRVKVSPAHYDY